MSFKFVNNATIDRKARRLIRSHAAKGKNVGKTRPPRREPFESGIKKIRSVSELCAVENEDEWESHDAIPTIERQVGDGLSVLSFPIGLNSLSEGLVRKGELLQP